MTIEIQKQLAELSDPKDAQFLQRYFKTGPGEYGAGDIFRGIRVPHLRRLSRLHRELPREHTIELLQSAFHEERLLALFILVLKYGKADEPGKAELYGLYLANTRFINNWDLVDCSAQHIVGAYLRGRDPAPLQRLAQSPSLWERRIAIMANFHYLPFNQFDIGLDIATHLLTDREDLIHKAVGWYLREVGKRDMQREEAFLKKHHTTIPRTMLRYAIERLPQEKRMAYLKR